LRAIYFGKCQILQKQIEYYLLADEFGHIGESYGVRIDCDNGETASVRGITLSQSRIQVLMDMVLRNTVTPSTLRDVVEDWILL